MNIRDTLVFDALCAAARKDLLIYGNAFIHVDYPKLELQTLASARVSSKNMNFGNPSGMQWYGESEPTRPPCKRCGAQGESWVTHSRRDCDYVLAVREHADLGLVPISGVVERVFKHAGVALCWGTSRSSRIAPWVSMTRKAKAKRLKDMPLRQGYYAPVWAVVLYENAKLGSLTSTKRQRVRQLIAEVRQTTNDAEAQRAIAGEHILQGGPYTGACKALIGRTMR